VIFGHVAGLPIEETVATTGPAVLFLLTLWGAQLRARFRRRYRDSRETSSRRSSP
jgi:hypothetical protein